MSVVNELLHSTDKSAVFNYDLTMRNRALSRQKVPLLWPVTAWAAGLALARTDFLNITVALSVFVAAAVVKFPPSITGADFDLSGRIAVKLF